MTAAEQEERTPFGAGASRPASLVVALTVGAGLLVAAATGRATAGVALMAATGVALGAATLCRAREGPAWAAVGAALTPLIALGAVAGIALVAAGRGVLGAAAGGDVGAVLPAVALAGGGGLAAFGATGTLGDGIGEGAVRRVHRSALATATIVGTAFGAILLARFDALGALPAPAVDLGALLDPVLSPGGPTVSLLSVFVLFVATALAGRAALSTLPITELAPRERREAVGRAVERLDADLRVAVKYGVIAASASLLTVFPVVRETLPVVGLGALVAPTGPRVLLLLVGAVAATLALVGRLLQAVTGSVAPVLGRLLPATTGGVLVLLVAFGAGGALRGLVESLPPAARLVATELLATLSPAGVVLGAVTVALGCLTATLLALVVCAGVGLVPTRGSSGALAGAGLTLCGVVLGVGSAPALATFALVGLGVVAWDASDQGVAARADLGPQSAGRIEAVRAVGSVAVATVGVGIAWLALGVVGTVGMADGVLVGAVAAVAGAVILLGVLRG
ncbi:hypothetical protein [Haloplanus aerogenes]|uniref:Uncharacterized protein n=1 Tax=Haloplanus aerogenes TaxID=660522 RepID=A0A3M0DRC0_9EURY|nr:hypothetical protein [Haloplanus aerogenes]AZH24197.1 hypothetical protein DU502_01875 [Haloplanus aerogenes]RMB24181.1 hypothetical protein ATH50_1421 [Haloplanus aerogenes]